MLPGYDVTLHCILLCSQYAQHYSDVIMSTVASQITSLTIVYSTVYLGADQRKHQGSTSLAFVQGIHRRLVNSPHKWPVTWKMFAFDDVIMAYSVNGALVLQILIVCSNAQYIIRPHEWHRLMQMFVVVTHFHQSIALWKIHNTNQVMIDPK